MPVSLLRVGDTDRVGGHRFWHQVQLLNQHLVGNSPGIQKVVLALLGLEVISKVGLSEPALLAVDLLVKQALTECEAILTARLSSNFDCYLQVLICTRQVV